MAGRVLVLLGSARKFIRGTSKKAMTSEDEIVGGPQAMDFLEHRLTDKKAMFSHFDNDNIFNDFTKDAQKAFEQARQGGQTGPVKRSTMKNSDGSETTIEEKMENGKLVKTRTTKAADGTVFSTSETIELGKQLEMFTVGGKSLAMKYTTTKPRNDGSEQMTVTSWEEKDDDGNVGPASAATLKKFRDAELSKIKGSGRPQEEKSAIEKSLTEAEQKAGGAAAANRVVQSETPQSEGAKPVEQTKAGGSPCCSR